MRITVLLALIVVAGVARAQSEAPREGGGPTRAPLAGIEDLTPAVDTSAAATPRSARPASEAPSAPSTSPAATASAPAEPPAAPGATAAPTAGRSTRVIDTLDLGTTSITGNQELPKVLYIVPWKQSDLGNLVGRPVNTLLDEVLAPVDPEVFERHLKFYESLYGDGEEE